MKNVSVNYREKYSYCVKMLLLCSFFQKIEYVSVNEKHFDAISPSRNRNTECHFSGI